MLNNQEIKIPVLIEDLGCLYPTAMSKKKYRYGLYLCQCGNKFKTSFYNIKNGHTKSCGCHKKQVAGIQSITHGLTKHPLYPIWKGINKRITNSNCNNFKDYGGRGIAVYSEWKNDFKTFYDWSINNGWVEGLSIDRINNDGNYEPSNCRWTTRTVQSRNQRKIMSTNKSGFRGVSWDKRASKWKTQITVNNKNLSLGYFLTSFDGAIAYDTYVISNNLEHTINRVL